MDATSNWNLFNNRLLQIKARIIGLLSNLEETQVIISLIEDFNKRYLKLLAQGNVTSNCFLNCQLIVSFFFTHMYPLLKKSVNPNVLTQ